MSTTTAIRERPILFSGPMVRAILDGRKSQTRRVVKPQPEHGPFPCQFVPSGFAAASPVSEYGHQGCTCREIGPRYGRPGDHIWVRETFFDHGDWRGEPVPVEERIEYRATPWERKGDPEEAGGWRPSIHMPRWASRLTLEITDVRVERVQEISEADARAEGFPIDHNGEPYDVRPIGSTMDWNNYGIASFSLTWQELNAARGYGWDVNPWVWVIGFRRLR